MLTQSSQRRRRDKQKKKPCTRQPVVKFDLGDQM